MTDHPVSLSGGCQCGAVRFRVGAVGRASICHCRMCQKAFGSFFGPLVTVSDLTWTRGRPKRFWSSNLVQRGFCAECGTPLTFEHPAGVELAIGAFDDPSAVPPTIQVSREERLPFFDGLPGLPLRPGHEAALFLATVVSRQHPDYDTAIWPPEEPTDD
ncbi:MAG: GFA family protein [Bauldia sp.]|nr:GFA family protein [Bauldia sp.]